jgi:hypothetical protein
VLGMGWGGGGGVEFGVRVDPGGCGPRSMDVFFLETVPRAVSRTACKAVLVDASLRPRSFYSLVILNPRGRGRVLRSLGRTLRSAVPDSLPPPRALPLIPLSPFLPYATSAHRFSSQSASLNPFAYIFASPYMRDP